MTQGEIDFGTPPYWGGDVARAKFWVFHKNNPHVYDLFCRFALVAARRGRTRFSARTVLHRIRWYTQIETEDPGGFKVNNNWSPFYARLFVHDFPEYATLFETRTAHADGGTR